MRDIKQLTAVRGLFALYVAIYHIFPRNTSFVANGYLSVDLFFILSGFIMTYVYSDKFKNDVGAKDYIVFLKARLARIYPLYVFVIMAISVLYYINAMPLPSFKDYTYLLFFFQSLTFVQSNVVPHAWSIAVEVLAYLLLPFVIKNMIGKKSLPMIILGGYLSFAGLTLVSTYGSSNGPMDVISGFPAVFRCFFSYFLGMAGYVILSQYQHLLSSWTAEALLIASCAIAFVFLNKRGFDLVVIASFAVIVPTLAQSNGIITRILSLRLFVYLGEISYSIYLIHYQLCRSLVFIPEWISERMKVIDVNSTALLLTVVISMATYHMIEIPCRNMIKAIRVKQLPQSL